MRGIDTQGSNVCRLRSFTADCFHTSIRNEQIGHRCRLMFGISSGGWLIDSLLGADSFNISQDQHIFLVTVSLKISEYVSCWEASKVF